jgi:drug/metabolite transporter (DMT)-like permease
MLCLWQRRWPTLVQVICLLMAFAGVAIAIGVDEVAFDLRGVGLAVAAAMGFGLSFAWNSVKLRTADAQVVTLYMLLSGGLVTAVIVAASGTYAAAAIPIGWLLVLIPAVCFTFAMLGMYEGVRRIGGAHAAMLMNLEPVFTVALAPVVLGEVLTPLRIVGGVLVIAAVYFSQRAGSDAGGS